MKRKKKENGGFQHCFNWRSEVLDWLKTSKTPMNFLANPTEWLIDTKIPKYNF